MLPRTFSLHPHDTLPSTQDEAHRLLATGEKDFVISARRQSAGRGRRGRTWESPAGASLLCSFGLVMPEGPASIGPIFALALAALETAANYLPANDSRLRVKWPNDVWADGKKLAGLLGEARCGKLALGIGLNLMQEENDFPNDLLTPATSLKLLGAEPVSAENFLLKLSKIFAARLLLWESGGLAPILERLAPLWQFRPGDSLRLQAGEEIISGEYLGIDGDGALRLLPINEKAPRTFHAAEAWAVRPAHDRAR